MKAKIDQVMSWASRYFWWWVALAMLVSFGLAMWAASDQSVWFDEGYSILLAQRPIHDLLFFTSVDAHPPLYYLLLKFWAGAFGWSEFVLRSLSAVLGALALGVTLLLVRTVFTKRIALGVLPFVTLAPFLIRYDYEIRMYALVSFIGVTATWLLVKAYQRGQTKWWIGYGILVALGMYTLYMSAAIWLAHASWLLVITIRDKKPLFRQKWLYAYGVALALFLPYLPTTLNQFAHSALSDIGKQVNFEMLSYIVGMLISYIPEWQIDGWLTLGLLALIVMVIQLTHDVLHRANESRSRMLGLFACLVLIPLGFFVMTSLPPLRAIFIVRYEAHVAIYIYLWVGLMVTLGWHYGKRYLSVATGALALCLLVGGVLTLQHTGNVNYERLQHPESKAVRADILCTKDTIIVADDPYTYIDSFYYFKDCDLRYYSPTELEARRGYAPLSGQPTRLASLTDIHPKTLVHLYWNSASPTLNIDTAVYKLASRHTFDKQVVDTYKRR